MTAAVATGEQAVSIAVPTNAIQTIGAGKAVFIRTTEGFEKRAVVTGRSDDRLAEVLTGLKAGETIARYQHLSAQGRVPEVVCRGLR
ncbi:hypothetical protein [Bradyrhizobium sp. LM2.3]